MTNDCRRWRELFVQEFDHDEDNDADDDADDDVMIMMMMLDDGRMRCVR